MKKFLLIALFAGLFLCAGCYCDHPHHDGHGPGVVRHGRNLGKPHRAYPVPAKGVRFDKRTPAPRPIGH